MYIKGTCVSSTADVYGPIYVYQTRTSRILSFDEKIYQSSMKLNDINGLDLAYTQAMMAGLLFISGINTVTIMGLGAGSMVKNLLHSFPQLNVHVVEYREAVVDITKKYFYLPDTERLSVHVDDAVNYIKSTELESDIIFSDLYNARGMEPRQVESGYLRDCKNTLSEGGVLVLNIWHTTLQSEKELNDLLALEFENRLLSFKVESGNTIVLAFKNDLPLIKRKSLIARAKWLQQTMTISMERYAKLLWSTQGNKFGVD